MATIKHSTTATFPDQEGAEINKAEWNDNHIIEGLVESIVSGANIVIDDTDPANPIISAIDNVGAVDSVNGQTGVVTLDADDISNSSTTNKYTTESDIAKLAGIEASADVTDTANVTAAGALMDSEVTNLSQVKAFDSSDYATAAQGATADSALQPLATTTDNAIYRADGTAGGIQGSAATISDDGITMVIGDATDNLLSIGVNNSLAGATTRAVVVGADCEATGTQSASIGVSNKGGGRNIGYDNKMTSGDGIGRNNIGSGVSIGSACTSGNTGTALGSSCQATGTNAVSIGQFSNSAGLFATSFGTFATAAGSVGFSLGVSTNAAGDQSFAMGRSVTASGTLSAALAIGASGAIDHSIDNSLLLAYDDTSLLMTATEISCSFGQVFDGDGSFILPDVETPPDAPASGVTTYSEGGLLKTKSALGEGTQTSLICNGGRWYCYTDTRWITDSDDAYGMSYYQFAENCGTGVDPITEWEHMGILIPAGKTIHKLHFGGRANNTQITDLEIHAILRRPNTADVWETGLNSDTEDNDVVLHRDNFYNPTDPEQTAFAGGMTHTHKRTIEINQVVEEDSFLSIFVKPIGTLSATRYFYSTYTWEII